MEKVGEITIRIKGHQGNIELTPETYDIRDIKTILDDFESLLFPNQKKDRPLISYRLEEGSVMHRFQTSMQAVLGFSAIIGQVNAVNNIDFLELRSAQAIENIQNTAYQKNYSFEIFTSFNEDVKLNINAKTKLLKSETIWADAEFYFYGTLTNAGGKSSVNIHLDTSEYGSLTIDTPKEFLKEKEENMLYKRFGVRAVGKQNSETGEFNRNSLKLIELFDFEPRYDETYLKSKISKAKSKWSGINKDQWLKDLRGGYDA